LWIDGRLLFDRWRQCWNASASYFTLNLEQGRRYPLKIEWIPDGGESYIALRYLTPLDDDEQQRISFWSEVADQIDYYFISGENMDEVISGYRTVTGKAPVMPEWAMGFWQSRQRYTNQEELLDVVREYRKRNIPFDNIVLDWQYWPADKWGDHQFDVTRFPDPDGMIRTLHDDLNARIMISVWPKYYVGTENYEAMKSKGYLYMRNVEMERRDWIGYLSTFYDAFNADARTAFWNQINIALYSRGIDAWWLDATEPDITSNLPMEERKAMMNPTALGSADRYFNAYSLVQAQGVYEGQRATDPENRVFILTRSAFAGLQRYSAANWSGDIAARWHDMAAQIPCGLNMSMSGIPWWTMDIGGFSVESRYHNPSPADLDEWRELMTRWHQYGAFVPLFRSHGEFPFREIYNTAPDNHIAYKTMVEYNRLRYRLMPYIYSLAGQAWLNDYTIMRGLTMDFSLDTEVFDIADQYMFGPSLMVNPVTEYKVRSRKVYLPSAYGWYDVRTGRHYAGGTVVEADAPYEWMPLFAREGSLIPTGPDIQYTGEKEADPLTLWVYAGADGAFELYEDEGDNYNYEDGAYTLIPLTWNEAERTLTIGKREGEYRGMLHERTINVIMVSENRAVKLDFGRPPDKSVKYSGEEIKVRFE
ncbi:MAG TPA: glycoside hydrolase family 31 protein, partial [Bacteroidales bacterium]|nr:glycoside hydrolase family 31 protein [Bacteroidales bacterium]